MITLLIKILKVDFPGQILRCKGGLVLLLIGVSGLLVSPLVRPALTTHLQSWTALVSGHLSPLRVLGKLSAKSPEQKSRLPFLDSKVRSNSLQLHFA